MATIPYSDVIDRQLLPVDSQNIVTKVRLVVAGNMAGAAPQESITRDSRGVAPVDAPWVQHFPRPIVYEYAAPEHAVYGVTRSLALPSGVTPFLQPTDPLIPDPTVGNLNNPGAPSAVRDGDPLTHADGPINPDAQTYVHYLSFPPSVAERVVGFRLQHELIGDPTPFAINRRVNLLLYSGDVGNPFVLAARHQYVLVSTGGTPVDFYAVGLWDARGDPVNAPGVTRDTVALTAGVIPGFDPGGWEWRITAFYPLVLDTDLLDDIARAQIRLPALLPQRVTVRGYVSPDREHTISGWPGGDYTGVVAQHQYELGRTVIDFEQAGSPVGLPAEAIEAARERKQAIDGTVQTANYNLMMGSRR